MPIIRWDPFQLSRSSWPFDEEDLSLPSWSAGTGNNLEIAEDENKVIVKANVAGVDSDDVEVNFQDGRLWIKAAVKEQERDQKAKIYRSMSRSYSYVVDLPNVSYNAEARKAELDKGVLVLEFDKTPEAKPKKISVKAK